jgi:hypothetical protein
MLTACVCLRACSRSPACVLACFRARAHTTGAAWLGPQSKRGFAMVFLNNKNATAAVTVRARPGRLSAFSVP